MRVFFLLLAVNIVSIFGGIALFGELEPNSLQSIHAANLFWAIALTSNLAGLLAFMVGLRFSWR